jgi:hypothetical protein
MPGMSGLGLQEMKEKRRAPFYDYDYESEEEYIMEEVRSKSTGLLD